MAVDPRSGQNIRPVLAKAAANRLTPGSALLIVDVQVDFCPGGALPIEAGHEVVPVLNGWIHAARDAGVRLYASRDWHPRGHLSFLEQGGPWPAHCVQDTPGARHHPDLALPEDVVQISKGVRFDRDQYSAFDETGLAERLKQDGVRELWIGGLALDVCVRATVLDALGAAFGVHLIVDGTRAVDPGDGVRALRELREAGASIEESE